MTQSESQGESDKKGQDDGYAPGLEGGQSRVAAVQQLQERYAQENETDGHSRCIWISSEEIHNLQRFRG